MALKQPKTITKTIQFPIQLYQMLNKKAKEVGLTFNEYVRHIAVNIVEGDMEIIDDPKLVKQIRQVEAEYEQGKYIKFNPNNPEELRKALPLD